jgi:hypothetical protein
LIRISIDKDQYIAVRKIVTKVFSLFPRGAFRHRKNYREILVKALVPDLVSDALVPLIRVDKYATHIHRASFRFRPASALKDLALKLLETDGRHGIRLKKSAMDRVAHLTGNQIGVAATLAYSFRKNRLRNLLCRRPQFWVAIEETNAGVPAQNRVIVA